ncbi:hypothetical protein NP493_1430g00059 [Ridgeia piscesae]|uniref:HMG box domain-containing protein n=1 Tax=Ridgeia piscesae TaxID=27915 RepID=A0AAD9K4A8_RIDPI|nr:hypothetical protein NP493_1430g00059 [Ridgeia piscesae]
MDVISPSAYDMELDDGGGILQIAEQASAQKRRLMKKKTRKRESEGANGLKTLLLGETVAKKKKKSSKKQMTMSQSTDEEEFMATMNAFGQEHTQAVDGLDTKLPVYANASEMALKLKTSAERKASKQRKYKKGKTKEDPLKPRKRPAPTAYMLWCVYYRQKVITETPGIDFVQMSKRLGELWQALPEKKKMSWKRKARKAATKGTTMISTGKTGHAKSGHVGTVLMSGQHQVKGSTSKRAVSHGDGHTIAGQSDQEHKMTAFNVSGHRVQPMAHLGIRNCSPTAIKQYR